MSDDTLDDLTTPDAFRKSLSAPCEASCDCDCDEEVSVMADREERDSRSIFISNIDMNTTQEDLQEHFSPCGPIVSIVITKVKGSMIKRKVFLEFEDISSVDNGLLLNESILGGRTLRVLPKRTNIRNFAPKPRYDPSAYPQLINANWTQWPNQQWQTTWVPNFNPQMNFSPQQNWQNQQIQWLNAYRK